MLQNLKRSTRRILLISTLVAGVALGQVTWAQNLSPGVFQIFAHLPKPDGKPGDAVRHDCSKSAPSAPGHLCGSITMIRTGKDPDRYGFAMYLPNPSGGRPGDGFLCDSAERQTDGSWSCPSSGATAAERTLPETLRVGPSNSAFCATLRVNDGERAIAEPDDGDCQGTPGRRCICYDLRNDVNRSDSADLNPPSSGSGSGRNN